MSDLRNLTFAINIEGDEKPVVKTDKAMDKLVKTTGGATKELSNTSDGIKELGNNRTTFGIDKSKDKVEKLTKSIGATQKELKDVSGSMKKFGGSLNKWVTLPLVGVGLAGAKLNKDLNESLGTISTLIPGQTARINELRGSIQNVSIDVAKSTDEIADATYGVISAYGDAADTMDKVALNAKAARAGVASTNDALNLSSAIMKGYGDTSAEMNEKVLDLAFATLKLGQTSFPELASSMGQVVPLATELKVSQEDLFGVYAAATGVTGNASEVSTQYRGVLQSLMAPTKDMSKLMSKMGYESGQAMIEGEGLGGTIQSIVDNAKASGTPLKDYIGSIQGQTLALALAGSLSEDYASKTEQLYKSSGMMQEAFEEQTQGINASGFSYEQSMQRMKVAGQNLGEATAPMISAVADGFAFISEKLASLSPETLQTISQIGMLALALGPIIMVGGKIIGGIGTAIGVFSTVSGAIAVVTTGAVAATPAVATLAAAFTMLTGPIGITIGIMGVLVAGGVALYKNWGTVSEWAKSKGAEIAQDWQYTKDRTVQAWKDMTKGISDAMGSIKDGWNNLVGIFKKPATGTVDITRNVTDKASTTGKSTASIASSAKVDGSHYSGLAKVPKDNYLANLHKNEEVLTADDPRNQNNPRPKLAPSSKSEKSKIEVNYNPQIEITVGEGTSEKDKSDLLKEVRSISKETFMECLAELYMQLA